MTNDVYLTPIEGNLLLEHIFIFISQINEGMKWLLLSIAWIAQMVERKVTTLKVKGSILLWDKNWILGTTRPSMIYSLGNYVCKAESALIGKTLGKTF